MDDPKECEKLELAEDAIGLAAYGMDSHHVQRYVDVNGYVKNEGNVEAYVADPFPISFRVLYLRGQRLEILLFQFVSRQLILLLDRSGWSRYLWFWVSLQQLQQLWLLTMTGICNIFYEQLKLNLLKHKQILQ